MMNLFDIHSRPLPRFYDLTIERRAEAIMVERNAVRLRRRGLSPRAYYLEVKQLSYFGESVALLDIVPRGHAEEMYRRILLGETYA